MQQLIANIAYAACSIFLVAISFSLIFSAARFFHFAHASVIAIAPYVVFTCSYYFGLPMVVSITVAILVTGMSGWLIDRTIYRPMRQKGATSLVLLLASLGLYIVFQNTLAIVFGDDTKIIGSPVISPALSILGMNLTVIQLVAIALAVGVLFSKILLLDKSRSGLILRAVADNPDLARVSGIDFDRAMVISFVLGSCVGGSIGIIRAIDVGMTPTMGLPMLLLGVVAVVVGGNGKTIGIAIASLLLAAFQQYAGWQIGTKWEEVTAFVVLIAFLLWRPQGIVGKSLRKATV